MIFDHDGTSIYPPTSDTDSMSERVFMANVLSVLDNLTTSECNFYVSSRVIHEPIDIAVDLYLRKGGYKAEVFEGEPPARPVQIPRPMTMVYRPGETPEMLTAGRRALRHIWESRIRAMMNNRRSARRVMREMWCYHQALAIFESEDEVGLGTGVRCWITDTSHELLRARDTKDTGPPDLIVRQPALPGTLESANLRGNWVMKCALGAGGFGVIFLWLRYDSAGRICGVRENYSLRMRLILTRVAAYGYQRGSIQC
jgi:hypothetical protein